ncbi:MAG: hypothetical protein J7L19_03110 [Dehalococcoidia bacterium]|nr:hypothetical protein [Dehalococcoidia bacterium]
MAASARVGSYQNTWYPDEKWGIGQHEVSDGNFLVGFSIWSDKKPSLIPEPLLLPDVTIELVDVPPQAKCSYGFTNELYTNTLTIMNHESVDVQVDWSVDWDALCSDFEICDKGTVTVPADRDVDISHRYFYKTVGIQGVTYTISQNGRELDSWSGSIDVIGRSGTITVSTPSTVKVGESYEVTITLTNEGSDYLDISWSAHSTITGEFDGGTILMIAPHEDYVMTRSYHCDEPGSRTITYKMFCYDDELDSWSGELNVIP